MVERLRPGDIHALLPRLELAAVVSWSHMRLRSYMLLRLGRRVGGLRQEMNRPSGRGSGRMYEIFLECDMRRLQWRHVSTWQGGGAVHEPTWGDCS